jgi:hypothetical protein
MWNDAVDSQGGRMPGKGTMFRISILTIAFTLVAGGVVLAQGAGSQGNEQERAACHPDVMKYCQTQLMINPNDMGGILYCLQQNRTQISAACQKVLSGHGV